MISAAPTSRSLQAEMISMGGSASRRRTARRATTTTPDACPIPHVQPASQVPACGPGLGYMMDTLAFADVLQKVLAGSGECAAVDWRFVGLTLPGWTLVFFLAMIVAAIALIKRD